MSNDDTLVIKRSVLNTGFSTDFRESSEDINQIILGLKDCAVVRNVVRKCRATVYRMVGPSITDYIRKGGMLMNFSFQDLISFGTFIIALLSFIYKIKKK